MESREIEKQLTVLQDIEAIKQLKAEYCDICDDDHNQDRILTIFSEDGIWEGKGIAPCSGACGNSGAVQGLRRADQFFAAQRV